ncbi:MAG: hypothetical protein AAF753_02040 [Pseudomonadota bacterium]
MFKKLFKSSGSNASAATDVPTPDLSRIFKPEAGEAPVADTAETAEAHANERAEASEMTGAEKDGPPAQEADPVDRAAWLHRDVDALAEAFDTFSQRVASKDARRALFVASHNLRGTARPLGNPVLERLSGSLCRLLEETDPNEPVVALANLHVGAMRAALNSGSGGASAELADAVCVALEDQVTAKLGAAGLSA